MFRYAKTPFLTGFPTKLFGSAKKKTQEIVYEKRELARWINDDSALRELIGSDERVYDNALHRTALMLWEHRVEIEKSLRATAKELFSLDEKIILYDLTNTYFEGKKLGSTKAQFGRSKEKRSDCKLMTLAVTRVRS